MKTNRKRKEVVLDEETLTILEEKAKRQGRNLKNYMEYVLKEDAYAFEPSEAYKAMMDKMIENHEQGKTSYLTEEDFKSSILKR